jgi:hypothetical protein
MCAFDLQRASEADEVAGCADVFGGHSGSICS